MQLTQLEDELKAELSKVEFVASEEGPLAELQIRPTLAAMSVRLVTLLWLPNESLPEAQTAFARAPRS